MTENDTTFAPPPVQQAQPAAPALPVKQKPTFGLGVLVAIASACLVFGLLVGGIIGGLIGHAVGHDGPSGGFGGGFPAGGQFPGGQLGGTTGQAPGSDANGQSGSSS